MVTNTGQTAGYFTSMQEVAFAQIPYFLTRDTLSGYLAPNSSPVTAVGGIGCDSDGQVQIPAGSVLKMLGLYEDVSSLVLKTANNHKQHKSKHYQPTIAAGLLSSLEPSLATPLVSGQLHTVPSNAARYVKCMVFANDRLQCNLLVFVSVRQTGR